MIISLCNLSISMSSPVGGVFEHGVPDDTFFGHLMINQNVMKCPYLMMIWWVNTAPGFSLVNHTSLGQAAANTTGQSNQDCETMCQLGHIIILRRCPGSKFSGHSDGSLRQPSWPIVWISDSYPSSTKHADISNKEFCCSFKAMFSGNLIS